jgi:hypothetical protein
MLNISTFRGVCNVEEFLAPCVGICNIKKRINNTRVKWVPCHRGIARPQVAHREDCLWIWKVAANILNKQSRTADGVALQLGSWAQG